MDIRDLGNKKVAGKKKEVGTTVPQVVPSVTPDSTVVDAHGGSTDSNEVSILKLREELSADGYTDEVYSTMLDTLMTGEEYSWNFTLFGKMPCKFRIRPDWVNQVLVQRMEEIPPKTMVRFTDTLNRYNLAGSIAQYGTGTFVLEDEAALTETLAHLGRLPFVIINGLITELVIFDKVTTVAMSPWAIRNFTKPQSEK